MCECTHEQDILEQLVHLHGGLRLGRHTAVPYRDSTRSRHGGCMPSPLGELRLQYSGLHRGTNGPTDLSAERRAVIFADRFADVFAHAIAHWRAHDLAKRGAIFSSVLCTIGCAFIEPDAGTDGCADSVPERTTDSRAISLADWSEPM